MLIRILKWDVRLRDAAFVQDRGDRGSHIHKDRVSGPNAASLFPVDHILFVEGMPDIVILRVGGNDPFLRRAELLLLFRRRCRTEADIDQVLYFLHRHRTVQKDRDPVSPADMVSPEISVLLNQQIRKQKVIQLDVQDVGTSFSADPELFL